MNLLSVTVNLWPSLFVTITARTTQLLFGVIFIVISSPDNALSVSLPDDVVVIIAPPPRQYVEI